MATDLPELLLPGGIPPFKAGDYSLKTDPLYKQVERQTGTSRRRRLFRTAPEVLTASIQLNQAQLEEFYAWHEGPLRAGAAEFTAVVARMGQGLQYQRARILTWSAETEEGSQRTITLSLKLFGEGVAIAPVDRTMSTEIVVMGDAVFNPLSASALAIEFSVAGNAFFDTGALFSLEVTTALDTSFGGPLTGGASLQLEINTELVFFCTVETGAELTLEIVTALDTAFLEDLALFIEYSVPATVSADGSLVGYLSPADIYIYANNL